MRELRAPRDAVVVVRLSRRKRLLLTATEPEPLPTDDWWDVDTACERLKVSRSTLLRWRTEHGLPSISVGNSVRFDPARVREWLGRHEVAP